MTGFDKQWRIDAPGQTLVLSSQGGIPGAIYWGETLPAGQSLVELARANAGDVTGGMLDVRVPLSLCPQAAEGFEGQPGLVIYRAGRMLYPEFELISHDEGAFLCRDADLGLELELAFDVVGDVICARTHLRADQDMTLHHLCAPAWPRRRCGDR